MFCDVRTGQYQYALLANRTHHRNVNAFSGVLIATLCPSALRLVEVGGSSTIVGGTTCQDKQPAAG